MTTEVVKTRHARKYKRRTSKADDAWLLRGYINPSRVSELLGLTAPTVYRWGALGYVKVVEDGRRRFFDVASLRAYLADESQTALIDAHIRERKAQLLDELDT
jgi:hypothetical protein